MVADKGLNSGDNVAFLMAKGDGFIFSQKIRGADQELRSYALDPKDYIEKEGVVRAADLFSKDSKKPIFLMKSRPFPHKF